MNSFGRTRLRLVVIGASAGAVESLNAILPMLPADYPLPLAVVVHLPSGRASMFPEIFQESCKLSIREAEDKTPLQPGTVYFAPPDYHLLVEDIGELSLSSEEPVNFSRPSIDVLFESAVAAFGGEVVGVLLSGGSNDGSAGLRAISEAGGQVVVQDPATSYAKAMPTFALAACPDAQRLSLPEIVTFLSGLESL